MDWADLETRFEQTGPLSVPEKPDWVSWDSYCSTAYSSERLSCGIEGMPGGPLNGPNRSLYGPMKESEVKGGAVILNTMELSFHPLAVNVAYNAAGEKIGLFAIGVEFADKATYPDATSVAEDPKFKAEVAEWVASCNDEPVNGVSSAACDETTKLSLAAGDARIGELITH